MSNQKAVSKSQPEAQPQPQPPQAGSKQQVTPEQKEEDISAFSGDTTFVSQRLLGSRKSSNSLVGVILTWPGCAIGCISLILWVIFVLVIPTAMITIGAMYLGKDYCDDERIAIALVFGGPLWLISAVAGSVTRAAVALQAVKKMDDAEVRSESGTGDVENVQKLSCCEYWSSFIQGLITLIEGIWLIVFSIFVYQAYEGVNYDVKDDTDFYCHRTLYVFSFALVTACWTLVGYCFVTFFIWQCVWYFCATALRLNVNS